MSALLLSTLIFLLIISIATQFNTVPPVDFLNIYSSFSQEQQIKGTGKCHRLDCKPGICIVENKTEKCLCPLGFTSKDDHCTEITLKTTNVMTTVMLMIIVAGASVILTTLFGISICYYYAQRNEIQ